MALWAIEADSKNKAEQWDDGELLLPHEDDFNIDLVKEYAGKRGFNYIGTPNWCAPEQELPEDERL